MRANLNAITTAMLNAAREQAGDRWPAVRQLARMELQKLAATLARVKDLLDKRQIDAVRARALVRMQENTARDVLRTIEGIGVLTSRRAVDAAIRAGTALIDFKDPRSSTPSSTAKETAVATRATAASTEPAQETAPNFKAGKDLTL